MTTSHPPAAAAEVVVAGDVYDDDNDDAKAEDPLPFTILRKYSRQRTRGGFEIVIARGSVLDFASRTGAIVNAANEGCLGGGGVDGAITAAGGENLAMDRIALPILSNPSSKDNHDMSIDDEDKQQGAAAAEQQQGDEMQSNDHDDDNDDDDDDDDDAREIRCYTGSAVLTGPGDYGDLQVPYVVHAVGPNFWMCEPHEGMALLVSAYQTSLDVAAETGCITDVAFSLLSAGVFRARIKLSVILKESLQALQEWEFINDANKNSTIERVYMFGFTNQECSLLVRIGNELFGKPDSDTVETVATVNDPTTKTNEDSTNIAPEASSATTTAATTTTVPPLPELKLAQQDTTQPNDETNSNEMHNVDEPTSDKVEDENCQR